MRLIRQIGAAMVPTNQGRQAMTTHTTIATSTLMLAAAVLALGMATAADAGPLVKRPVSAGITDKVYGRRTYHPPRGCLGDPTCKPGTYSSGGGGYPDTGWNCTYSAASTHCSEQ